MAQPSLESLPRLPEGFPRQSDWPKIFNYSKFNTESILRIREYIIRFLLKIGKDKTAARCADHSVNLYILDNPYQIIPKKEKWASILSSAHYSEKSIVFLPVHDPDPESALDAVLSENSIPEERMKYLRRSLVSGLLFGQSIPYALDSPIEFLELSLIMSIPSVPRKIRKNLSGILTIQYFERELTHKKILKSRAEANLERLRREEEHAQRKLEKAKELIDNQQLQLKEDSK